MSCNCPDMPSLASQAATITVAAAKVVGAAFKLENIQAPEETFQSRMAICLKCDKVVAVHLSQKVIHRCRVCGCWLDRWGYAKAHLKTERCPKGKW